MLDLTKIDEYSEQGTSSEDYHAAHRFQVSRLLKYFLLGFAIFFWIVGGMFLFCGYYVNKLASGYLPNVAIEPGTILSLLGVLVFAMSTSGVLGTLRENLCLLKTYRIFLLITLFLEIFCACISFAYFPEVKKLANGYLNSAIKNYWDDENIRNVVDNLQSDFECCGSLYIDDWDSNPYFSCKNVEDHRSCGVPWSCCLYEEQRNLQCGHGIRNYRSVLSKKIYTVGCLDKTFEAFREVMAVVGGMTAAFSFPLLFAILFIPSFIRQVDRQKNSYVVNEDGL